jgi:hypothetical protein
MMGNKVLAIAGGDIHISNKFLSTIKNPLDIRGIVQQHFINNPACRNNQFGIVFNYAQ